MQSAAANDCPAEQFSIKMMLNCSCDADARYAEGNAVSTGEMA
jgi:hypothetical protein